MVLNKRDAKRAVELFETELKGLRIIKFVPASGAATRMFKRIFDWVNAPQKHQTEIRRFFGSAEKLAFFEDWLHAADKADCETFESGLDSMVKWLRLLVEENGLAFAQKPKALIPFHLYESPTLPIEEHMKEAMAYTGSGGYARIHFTVSEPHKKAFEHAIERLKKTKPFEHTNWDITLSSQHSNTDTVAVDLENNPVHINGQILKRPGGHGALIHNLNQLDADLIFIKNIDNVAHDKLLEETVFYKKMLAGKLLELRKDLQSLNASLKKGLLDEQVIQELREKWGVRIPKDYKTLREYLKRPIRVCGMVKNEGEPGGGPFWTKDDVIGESLQIVEQAQINPKNSRQQRILKSSTHFNPVDLVCFIRDLEGNKINLPDFVNRNEYFIAKKSFGGMGIKALEWPGLWNGAMGKWITIFVEVPISTFNPVKEITDLLRDEHL